MSRHAWIVLWCLLAIGCGEQSGGEAAALEKALEGTRQGNSAQPGHTAALPLDGADPHHLRMDASCATRGWEKSSTTSAPFR